MRCNNEQWKQDDEVMQKKKIKNQGMQAASKVEMTKKKTDFPL